MQLVILKVAPVIEDAEFLFIQRFAVFIVAVESRTEARATANHLPELHFRFDWFGKDQIHNLRDINTSVEHIYRDSDGQLFVGAFIQPFKIVNQLLGAGIVVVDDLAEASGKLRVHVVEQLI